MSVALRDGSHSRFDTLYRTNLGAITAYVRRRLPYEDADDVVAAVFETAWRLLDELPPPPEDRLFLFGVARRAVATQHRSSLRRRRLLDRVVDELSREDNRFHREGLDELELALFRLVPADREIVRLVCVEGRSHREIAQVLGCSANAAELRYRRARKRLLAELSPVGSAARRLVTHDEEMTRWRER